MSKKICIIEGCGKKHLAGGYCNSHYLRNKRKNNADQKSCYEMNLEERLKSFTKIDFETQCWIWIGAKNRKGYGQISIDNRRRISHRVSYEHYKGKITDGMLVCHHCDTPSCINPEHLFLGTYLDNSNDKFIKGRFKALLGDKNGNSKLKSEDVIKIKKMIFEGKKLVEIAKLFNVNPENIGAIRNGKTWSHINV